MIKDAEAGGLVTEDQVRAYAKSMAGDERVRAKTRELLESWLNLEHLLDLSKDQDVYKEFDAQLIAHLRRSLHWTLGDIVDDEQSTFEDLFRRKHAYTSDRLHAYYGDAWAIQKSDSEPADDANNGEEEQGLGKSSVGHSQGTTLVAKKDKTSDVDDLKVKKEPKQDRQKETKKKPPTDKKEKDVPKKNESKEEGIAKEGEQEEPEEIEDNSDEFVGLVTGHDLHLQLSVSDELDRRHGVFQHPYLLSGLAYFDATSPIHRGVFLIRYVLGRTLRPPNAAFSPLSQDLHPDLTTRQRVELQTSPDSCQVCHSKINALGFTLENYDATGRYRLQDNGHPVDPRGSYDDRSGQKVALNGPAELAEYLVSSEDSVRGFVNRAFQHFTKQPPAAYGPDTLERLITKFKESDYRIRDLVVEIATIAAMQPHRDSGPFVPEDSVVAEKKP